MAIKKGKVITITSVKGGTGKTTTVLNLAGIFSSHQKKILIMDLDLYSSGIALSLNLEPKGDIYKLVDDLNNNRFEKIENYITNYNENIDVLTAPKDPRLASKISSKYINIIIARAGYKYDAILIDTNHIMNEMNLVAFDNSDEILYVITNDPVDLKNMRTMVSIYEDMELKNYKILLNEAHDRQRNYFNKYDIKNILKDNIDYTIPESFYVKTIDKYVLDGKILTLDKKILSSHKKSINNFELIYRSLMEETKKESKKNKTKVEEN